MPVVSELSIISGIGGLWLESTAAALGQDCGGGSRSETNCLAETALPPPPSDMVTGDGVTCCYWLPRKKKGLAPITGDKHNEDLCL